MTEFIRPDGRVSNQMRKLTVEVGILDRADGSARVELGENMAIASVFGPRELHPKHSSYPDRAVVRVNYRMATFSVKDYKKSYPSRREKEISKVLSDAFESVVLTKLYPRSAVDVHVQIFQSDGGTRTAAAIATSAALADAGIPMRDLTGGIASGIYEDHVVLDLCGTEDMKGTGDMPILYSPNIDEVSLFQLDGMFTFEQFKEAFNNSKNAINTVVETIQEALKRKYVKTRQEIIADRDDDDDDDEDQQSHSDETLTEEEVETVTLGDDEDDEDEDDEDDDDETEVEETQEFEIPQTSELDNSAASEPEQTSDVVEKSSEESAVNEEKVEGNEEDASFDPRKISAFDRSTLKPMGGNAKVTTEQKKPERSSSDILRDLEYTDLEDQ